MSLQQKLRVFIIDDNEMTREHAMRNGAKGYIVKPFNPGTVMDALDSIATQIKARHAASRA